MNIVQELPVTVRPECAHVVVHDRGRMITAPWCTASTRPCSKVCNTTPTESRSPSHSPTNLSRTLMMRNPWWERTRGQKGASMPFVHDQTEIEWPEDDSEPEPPRANQFVYIPPPEFGGAREPVRFSVVLPDASLGPNEPHPPAEREPPAQAGPPRRSILDRLLGRPRLPAAQQSSQGAYQEERKRREQAQDQRRLQLFAVMVPALREIGGRPAYCRYDGGNDEGFAWLDSIE